MSDPLRLRHQPSALLNQLFHLGPVGMTIRGLGITVFRKTGFGGFNLIDSDGGRILHDRVSGLRVGVDRMAGVYAVPLADGHATAISFDFDGWPGALSLLPDPGSDIAALGRIVHAFAEEEIPASRLKGRGVDTWLDEWIHEGADAHFGSAPEEFGEALTGALLCASRVEVLVYGPGLESKCVFSPGLVDRDGSVLRVASRGADEVAFVDLGSPANVFVEEGGCVRILNCATASMQLRRNVMVGSPSPAETPC